MRGADMQIRSSVWALRPQREKRVNSSMPLKCSFQEIQARFACGTHDQWETIHFPDTVIRKLKSFEKEDGGSGGKEKELFQKFFLLPPSSSRNHTSMP